MRGLVIEIEKASSLVSITIYHNYPTNLCLLCSSVLRF